MVVGAHVLISHDTGSLPNFGSLSKIAETKAAKVADAVALPHVQVRYTGLLAPLTAAGTVATSFAESAPLAAVFRWAATEKALRDVVAVNPPADTPPVADVVPTEPAQQQMAALDPALPVPDAVPPSQPAADDASSDRAEDTPLPIPRPDFSPLVDSVPMPIPRPTELAAPTPATQAPTRLARSQMAQRSVRAPMAPVDQADNRSFFEKIFGGSSTPSGPQLAYANPEDGLFRRSPGSPMGAVSIGSDRQTAVYDISAHTVYLPDGTQLEAHSGLGDRLDNPRFIHERMRGPTPPHLYDLTMRESLFHGVQALRLNPVGGGGVFGRTGLLAHTFMLGPNGDSNGCVSFRNYQAFLNAFQSGMVRRLQVVVSRS